MKRTLSSLFIALFLAGFAQAIQVGDPENEVAIALGNPVAVRKKSDGAQVLKFQDGTTVWLADGVVQKIAGPSVGNSIHRTGSIASTTTSSSEVAAPEKKIPATVSPAAPPPRSEVGNGAVDDLEKFGYLLLVVGLAVILVSKVRFWIIAFRTSGWWLLGCIFVPFVSLLFVFTHWRETRNVFAWQMLVALPLIVGGIYLTPAWQALEHGRLN